MKRNNYPLPYSVKGVTLIELMIGLVIAAVLITAAAPSFVDMIRENRLTTYANEFGTTVNLARSEAIKRGTSISITSANGTDWSQGWTLNVVNTGELLRTSLPMEGDNTFNSGVNNTITFNSRGSTTLGAEETWSLCNANLADGRQIRIAVTGRISVREINPCP